MIVTKEERNMKNVEQERTVSMNAADLEAVPCGQQNILSLVSLKWAAVPILITGQVHDALDEESEFLGAIEVGENSWNEENWAVKVGQDGVLEKWTHTEWRTGKESTVVKKEVATKAMNRSPVHLKRSMIFLHTKKM